MKQRIRTNVERIALICNFPILKRYPRISRLARLFVILLPMGLLRHDLQSKKFGIGQLFLFNLRVILLEIPNETSKNRYLQKLKGYSNPTSSLFLQDFNGNKTV